MKRFMRLADQYFDDVFTIFAAIVVILFMFAFLCAYDTERHTVHYQTVTVTDNSGRERDCVVFTHVKGMAVDCVTD